MKTDRALSLFVLTVVAIIPSSAAERRGAAASIESVAAAYDSTEEALKDLVDASQSGDVERTRAAGGLYNRALSRFHIELARWRIDRRHEAAFLKRLALQTNSQLESTRSLAENARPASLVVLNEATSHLKGSLELVDHELTRSRRVSFKISIRGPESTRPGQRSSPPPLPPNGIDRLQ